MNEITIPLAVGVAAVAERVGKRRHRCNRSRRCKARRWGIRQRCGSGITGMAYKGAEL